MAISSLLPQLQLQQQQQPLHTFTSMSTRTVLPNGSRRSTATTTTMTATTSQLTQQSRNKALSSSSSSCSSALPSSMQLQRRVVPITRQGVHQSIRLHRKTLAEEQQQQQLQLQSRKLISQVPTTVAKTINLQQSQLQAQHQRSNTSVIKPTTCSIASSSSSSAKTTNSRLRQGALYARRQYHITTAATSTQKPSTTSIATTSSSSRQLSRQQQQPLVRPTARHLLSSSLRSAESQLLLANCGRSSRNTKTASKFSLASSTSSLTLTSVAKRARASPSSAASTPEEQLTTSITGRQRSTTGCAVRCNHAEVAAAATALVNTHRSVSSSALNAATAKAPTTRTKTAVLKEKTNTTTATIKQQVNRQQLDTSIHHHHHQQQQQHLVNNTDCADKALPSSNDRQTINSSASSGGNITTASTTTSDQLVPVNSQAVVVKKRLTFVGNSNSKLPYIISNSQSGCCNSQQATQICGAKQTPQSLASSSSSLSSNILANTVNINPPDDKSTLGRQPDCIYFQPQPLSQSQQTTTTSHTTHDFNMISEILICNNNNSTTINSDTANNNERQTSAAANTNTITATNSIRCDKMLLRQSSLIDNGSNKSPLSLNRSNNIEQLQNSTSCKENLQLPTSNKSQLLQQQQQQQQQQKQQLHNDNNSKSDSSSCQSTQNDEGNEENILNEDDCQQPLSRQQRQRSLSSNLSDEHMILGSPIVTPPPSDLELELDVDDNDDEEVARETTTTNTTEVMPSVVKSVVKMRPAPPDIEISLRPIADYYDLEPRPFARGKFAQVKRCVNKASNQCFAAKCIKKRRRLVDIRHEILLEIEALKLSHFTDRIVKLYQVFETSTEMILILEMANGGELQRVLDDEEVIEEPLVKRMISQILDALCELHANDIAHLDIKPQNLLLTKPFPEGDIKLCDFGISRRITKDCEIREICGTPDYVAPEILRYDPISLATDMWSLGVLTYVLLTGYSPFGSENKQQTFCNITQANLDFPSEIFDKISDEAIDFMRKLILREPSDRLTSFRAKTHTWLSHHNR